MAATEPVESNADERHANGDESADNGHPRHDVVEVINEALAARQTLPGFADPRLEQVNPIELPAWFVDRCRRGYLSVPFGLHQDGRVVRVTSTHYREGHELVAIGISNL